MEEEDKITREKLRPKLISFINLSTRTLLLLDDKRPVYVQV